MNLFAFSLFIFLSDSIFARDYLVRFSPNIEVVEPELYWRDITIPFENIKFRTADEPIEDYLAWLATQQHPPCTDYEAVDYGYRTMAVNGVRPSAVNFRVHFVSPPPPPDCGVVVPRVGLTGPQTSLTWECPEGFNLIAAHFDAQGNSAQTEAERDNLDIACVRGIPHTTNPMTCAGNPILCDTGTKWQTEIDIPATASGTLAVKRTYRSSDSGWQLGEQSHGIDLRSQRGSNGRPACFQGVGFWTKKAACFRYSTDFDVDAFMLRRDDGGIEYFTGPDWLPSFKNTKNRVRKINEGGVARFEVIANDNKLQRYRPDGKPMDSIRSDGVTETYIYSDATTPASIAPAPGYLIAIQDSFGRRVQFAYDAGGILSEAIDSTGQAVQYLNDSGRLDAVSYPTGGARQFLYDEPDLGGGGHGLLTGIFDETGHRFANWQYNSAGQAILSEHAGGAGKVEVIYSTGYSVSVAESAGSTKTFNFVNGGAPLNYLKLLDAETQSCPGCPSGVRTRRYAYDTNGNIRSETDFNGVTTLRQFDLLRNLEIVRTEASGTSSERRFHTSWHPFWSLATARSELSLKFQAQHPGTSRVLRWQDSISI